MSNKTHGSSVVLKSFRSVSPPPPAGDNPCSSISSSGVMDQMAVPWPLSLSFTNQLATPVWFTPKCFIQTPATFLQGSCFLFNFTNRRGQSPPYPTCLCGAFPEWHLSGGVAPWAFLLSKSEWHQNGQIAVATTPHRKEGGHAILVCLLMVLLSILGVEWKPDNPVRQAPPCRWTPGHLEVANFLTTQLTLSWVCC